jgi:hypothetical protein
MSAVDTLAPQAWVATAKTPGVSVFRLYLLRATYLLIVVGLGSEVWPALIDHTNEWTLWRGVGGSVLCAVSALALLGLRYPLQMLPLLFFELTWKTLWLVAIALPLWLAGRLDTVMETFIACAMGVIFPIVIPWNHVWTNYVKKPGDRWR